MFDAAVPARLLHQSGFEAQWNCKPHGLHDDDLRATLSRLVERGLLERETSCEEPVLQLTAEGGHLWECERLPIWERFAADTCDEDESGRPIVVISATSAEVCETFWRIGCEVRLFRSVDGRVSARTVGHESMIAWKFLPNPHVLVAVVDGSGPPRTDWQSYEARRTWWRSAVECDKFFGLVDH